MAGKLKQIASLLTGIPVEKFEDQEFKKTTLDPIWDQPISGDLGDIMTKPMTVRELLQKLGTDAMRNGLHTNVWANAFWSDYKQHVGYREGNYYNKCGACGNQFTGDKRAVRCEKCSIFYPNWIITDVRFPNEAQSVKERDGLMIRVNRLKTLSKKFTSEDGLQSAQMIELDYSKEHPSETGLDDYQDFDYVIENNGTIEELIEKVREILIKEKII